MEKKVQGRDKNYRGVVCAFVGTEGFAVFINCQYKKLV